MYDRHQCAHQFCNQKKMIYSQSYGHSTCDVIACATCATYVRRIAVRSSLRDTGRPHTRRPPGHTADRQRTDRCTSAHSSGRVDRQRTLQRTRHEILRWKVHGALKGVQKWLENTEVAGKYISGWKIQK